MCHSVCRSQEHIPYLFKLFKVCVVLFLELLFLCGTFSFPIHPTGGFIAGSTNSESCASLPFDFQTNVVHLSHESISDLLGNITLDSDAKSIGCVFISAVLAAPENSIFSIELVTENAAVYSSVDEQPLERYWRFERLID